MRFPARYAAIALHLLAAARCARAEPPPDAAAATPARWSASASAYTYLLPHGKDYVNPILAADHGALHLEGRYNYEDLDTGSLWAGYNWRWGEELVLGVTPMVGGVFGHLQGIAPGYEASLEYWRIALSGQGEYVYDTAEHSGSFFYSWTELSISPVDWARVGMVMQRTKAYATKLDVQRGLLVGLSHGPFSLTTYVFDIGQGAPPIILGIAADF